MLVKRVILVSAAFGFAVAMFVAGAYAQAPAPAAPPAAAPAAAPAPAPAAEAAPAQGDTIKLEIKMPKPMFIGTPKNIKSPNLEPPNTKRDAIMVPKDVTNVAAGKPVTASDKEPIIGEIELITDGDKEGADGSYVEFGPDLQWVQVDLGGPMEIFAIALWHYHQQGRVYKDTVVQVADDADFIQNVRTVFNTDHDNSAGLGVGKDKEYVETFSGRVADCKGIKGRYVRLYSKGNTSNDMNHYIEVEVYGRPAK